MSTEYRAAIVVGLPRDEIDNQDLIDDDDLEIFPPYYDGGADGLAGLEYADTPDYRAREIEIDVARLEELKKEFRELTGQEPKVYLTPIGH